MDNLIDTLLNVVVFAYIGLLMWLLFKKGEGRRDSKTGRRGSKTPLENRRVR